MSRLLTIAFIRNFVPRPGGGGGGGMFAVRVDDKKRMNDIDPCLIHGGYKGFGHVSRSTINVIFHLYVSKVFGQRIRKIDWHGTSSRILDGDKFVAMG